FCLHPPSTAVLHLLSVDPAHAAESNRNYWACAQWGSPCSTILSVFSIPPLNTWVSFQSAEQPLMGQFSVSGNTQVSRSVKSMKIVRLSGKSRRGAARIPGPINAAFSTRPSARSSTAKLRHGPRSSIHFRVIKRQFGYVKVRFRGLMKNTAQLTTLFALSNLWMARKQLMGMGELRV
ncbi:Transposase, partial [Pseudomonas amygdali pv. ulmi]